MADNYSEQLKKEQAELQQMQANAPKEAAAQAERNKYIESNIAGGNTVNTQPTQTESPKVGYTPQAKQFKTIDSYGSNEGFSTENIPLHTRETAEKVGVKGSLINMAALPYRAVGEAIGQGAAATQTAIESPEFQRVWGGTDALKEQEKERAAKAAAAQQNQAVQSAAKGTLSADGSVYTAPQKPQTAAAQQPATTEAATAPVAKVGNESMQPMNIPTSRPVYKTVDAAGKVSYGDQPVAGKAQSAEKRAEMERVYATNPNFAKADVYGQYAPTSTQSQAKPLPETDWQNMVGTVGAYKQAPIQSNVNPDRFADEATQKRIRDYQSAIAAGISDPSNAQARYGAKVARDALKEEYGFDVAGKIKPQEDAQALGQKDLDQRRAQTLEGWKSLLGNESEKEKLAQRRSESDVQAAQEGKKIDLAEKKLALESRPAPQKTQYFRDYDPETGMPTEGYVAVGNELYRPKEAYEQSRTRREQMAKIQEGKNSSDPKIREAAIKAEAAMLQGA